MAEGETPLPGGGGCNAKGGGSGARSSTRADIPSLPPRRSSVARRADARIVGDQYESNENSGSSSMRGGGSFSQVSCSALTSACTALRTCGCGVPPRLAKAVETACDGRHCGVVLTPGADGVNSSRAGLPLGPVWAASALGRILAACTAASRRCRCGDAQASDAVGPSCARKQLRQRSKSQPLAQR